MTPIREEIVHVKGHPKNIIIFLHGYIDNADVVDNKIQHMLDLLDDVAICIPQSPYSCEIHPGKKQWYSMHRFDPNDDRKTVATMEQSAAIYDKMGPGLMEAHSYLKPYIETCLNEYNLTEDNLFICGFSQGAMLAIYTALLCEQKIKGCISFSGMVTPHIYLMKNSLSTPDMFLIHGSADNLVRYEALDFTKNTLEKIGCKVETLTLPNENHRITEKGVKAATKFIKKKN